jgi:prepilin-type N-terminal cleavage/methylation domain-containing protein
MIKIKNFKIKNFGFSLIEMLVAVGVFAIVVTISSGVLISMSDAQQKILSLHIVQDNLSYAFDIMGKEIRTGTSYHCGTAIDDFNSNPQDCNTGGPSFTFLNASGTKITYRINGNQIERVVNGDYANTLVLTSPDTNITSLNFYVVGAPSGDHLQPRVTIVLKGTSGLKTKTKSFLNIQTTISQRLLDS